MARRRDWPAVIEKLNSNKTGEITLNMGSPGSAQVTRCRLLAEWNNLEATTVGAKLQLRLKVPGNARQYTLAADSAADINVAIVGVTTEAVPASFQLLVEIIQ